MGLLYLLSAREGAATPHDTPAPIGQEQAHHVGDTGRDGVLFPDRHRVTLAAARNDGKQELGTQWFGSEPGSLGAGQSGGLHHGFSEAMARISAQLDQPPRTQRAMVRDAGRDAHQGQQFGVARRHTGDSGMRPSPTDRIKEVGQRLLDWLEVERDGVHAVPVAGGRSESVVEDVTQVRAAVGTAHLGAHDAERAVFDEFNGLRSY